MKEWTPPERYWEVHIAGQTYYVDYASGESLATRMDEMTVKDWCGRSDHPAFVEVRCVDGAEMRLCVAEIRALVETGPDDRERWAEWRAKIRADRRWEDDSE